MKKTIFAVLTIAAIALAIPSTSHACRCFWRPFFERRVAYRASFYQSGARARVGYIAASNCAGGACELTAATPAPCDPVGACDVSTPAPCEPVGTCAPVVSTPCENGACLLERTTVPAPCDPVEGCATTGEYYPTGKTVETVAIDELIAILNQTRAAYGLGALASDASLESGAVRQARICAYSGTLTHGAGAAEILAVNASGLRAAVSQWLASPAHRSMLLNGGYRFAGVAVVRDNQGRAWCAVRFR